MGLYSDEEYKVSLQRNRILYSKIYILNFEFQRVGEISGNVIDTPSFSIDSNSDIRRTCNLTIVPTSSDFDIKENSQIWIDKYIKVLIGIQDNDTEEVIYTNMGIYLINNPSRSYDASKNTLSITGIDLMSKLTGMRNGYLSGTEMGFDYLIPQGSDIRDAIISTLELGGFTNYVVDVPSPTDKVPNDIKISVGGTIYDILKQLCEINSNYQYYFDVDGVFYYNKIPSGDNEPIRIDDALWKNVLIDYTSNISFEEVKNTIEVYGKTLSDGSVPYAIAQDMNEDSPFYIHGTAGVLRIVLSGGEYENIYTTDLAQQRANYELYLRCRLQDQITIKIIPCYWIDVNWLVEITLPNKQGTEKTELYLIKKVNTSVGINATQDITLMKYYPTDV